eukprot:TRINITY_DN890_c1_g3_i2.p1 TRINITY_DN890_c1_g3~~TRINITY_DN890_c1_g3_i2.p1  ORF type:complete len:902 (+),score=237.72 TRINITY_DN890_c1_g3_i2:47-2707(+)
MYARAFPLLLLAGGVEARGPVRAALAGVSERHASELSANSGTLWPYGRVPWHAEDIATESTLVEIAGAIAHLEAKTCLRFTECATRAECTSGPHLRFHESSSGCSSPVGMWGRNSITLNGCSRGATIHEIVHSMGFQHEHKRKDRDQYLRVDMDNVKHANRGSDFATMYSSSRDVGPYDYESILQYSAYDWAMDHTKPTIHAPYPIGQSIGLSPNDIANIDFVYNQCSDEFSAPTCRATVAATNYIAHSKTWSVEFNGLYGGLWVQDGKAIEKYTPLASHPRAVFSVNSGKAFARFEFTPNEDDDAGRTFTFGVRVEGNDGTTTECSVEVKVAADDAVCFGVSASDGAVCSGHGRCTGSVGAPCECNHGVTGHACSNCPFVSDYAFEETFGTWHEDDDVEVDFSFKAVGRGALRIGNPAAPRRVSTQLDVYPVSKPDVVSFHVAPMKETASHPVIRVDGVDDACISLRWDQFEEQWAFDGDALTHEAVKHGAREWNFFVFDVDYVAARVTMRANGVEIVSNHPMPAGCSTGVAELRFYEMMFIDDVRMTCGEPSPIPTPAPTPQPPTPAPTPAPPTQAPPPCSDRASWCGARWLPYCHLPTIFETCPGLCNRCPNSTPMPQISTPVPTPRPTTAAPTPRPDAPQPPTPQPTTQVPPTPQPTTQVPATPQPTEPTTATPQPAKATPEPTTAQPVPLPPTPAVTVNLKEEGQNSFVTAVMGSVVDGYSPLYPSFASHSVYVNGAGCRITWTHMDIEAHSTCRYDYVQIVDGTRSLGKFCGQELPGPMQLTSSFFRVLLVSDSNKEASGFAFDFVCDGAAAPPATPEPTVSDAPPTPAPTPLPTPVPVPSTPVPASCRDEAGETYCTQYAHLCRFTSFSETCRNTCGTC